VEGARKQVLLSLSLSFFLVEEKKVSSKFSIFFFKLKTFTNSLSLAL